MKSEIIKKNQNDNNNFYQYLEFILSINSIISSIVILATLCNYYL